MKVLFVANREEEWPYQIPGTAVARAREYLAGTAYTNGVCERVVNPPAANGTAQLHTGKPSRSACTFDRVEKAD